MSANTLPAKTCNSRVLVLSDIFIYNVLLNHPVSQGPEIRAVRLLPIDGSFAADAIPCFVRETEDPTFDWFKRYDDAAHLRRQVLSDRTARVLMLGCGNSTLSEDVRFILHHQEIGASSGCLSYDSVQGAYGP